MEGERMVSIEGGTKMEVEKEETSEMAVNF